MLSFSISYSHLIKFPYSAGATERGDMGWKQAQRQCDFTQRDFTNNFHMLNPTILPLELWYATDPYFQCVRFLMIELWANISQTQYNSSKILCLFFFLSLHLHMMNNPCTSHILVLIKWLPELIGFCSWLFFLEPDLTHRYLTHLPTLISIVTTLYLINYPLLT
jgi:hypothetical protein